MEFYAHPFPKNGKVTLSVKFKGGSYIMVIIEEPTWPPKPCWNGLSLRCAYPFILKQNIIQYISPGQGPLRFTAFALGRRPDLSRVWTSLEFSRYYSREIVGKQHFHINRVGWTNRGSRPFR